MRSLAFLFSAAAGAALLVDSARSFACGGRFVPRADVSVVTDHRMALSIGPQQTILWDKIEYDGDPREFAWVLPIREGARIEVANDEFFTALDQSSNPVVYPPASYSLQTGCALSGCSEDSKPSSENGGAGVTVVSESVVGPYEQATLRATNNDALVSWLEQNQFNVPANIQPTIAQYVSEGFDFIALKLRPQCSERSMRPVRVITPGSTPSLPLRMVAAGVGANVGIILYVISEGRYQPQNFPHQVLDDTALRWDPKVDKSNYEAVAQGIMGQANGRTWLIEYSDKPKIPLVGAGWQPPASRYPPAAGTVTQYVDGQNGLSDWYFGLCKQWSGSSAFLTPPTASPLVPCPETATIPDASDGDAIPPKTGGHTGSPQQDCTYLDDLDRALDGLHRADVWVTRMRSVLPVSALSADLLVEPAKTPDGRADATVVRNVHWTPYFIDDPASARADTRGDCAGVIVARRHGPYGSYCAMGIAATAMAAAVIRRRRRPRR